MKIMIAHIVIGLAILIMIAGCSDQKSNTVTTKPQVVGNALVKIAIPWPQRLTRIIPGDTQVIDIIASGAGMQPIYWEFTRPNSGSSVFVTEQLVPAGEHRLFSVMARPVTGSSDSIAFGSCDATLVPGSSEKNKVSVTLADGMPVIPGAFVQPEDLDIFYKVSSEPVNDYVHGKVVLSMLNTKKVTTDFTKLTPDWVQKNVVIKQPYSILSTLPPQTTTNNNVILSAMTNANGSTSMNRLDIAFVIDTTGSMYETINGVIASIQDFANSLTAKGLDVRYAVVTCGDDWNDADRPVFQFSPSVAALKSFLSNLQTNGGSGNAVSGLDALLFAGTTLSWRHDAHRVAVVMTDASVHQKGDGYGCSFTTANDVIKALHGQLTVFAVSGASVYVEPGQYDLSNLPAQLGGTWTALPTDGSTFDLKIIPVAENLKDTYVFTFPYVISPESYVSSTYEMYINVDTADGTKKWVKFLVNSM